jgi:hypothetical protein
VNRCALDSTAWPVVASSFEQVRRPRPAVSEHNHRNLLQVIDMSAHETPAGIAEIAFVVNPASASGKTGAKWPQILDRVQKTLTNFKVLMTEKPLQATALARQALTEG